MLINFSPMGTLNKPAYESLDEAEISNQIEMMDKEERYAADNESQLL